ncbi:SusD/RagB family nutrient-binding outer membrane lipoprotein [Roseivirga sp. BDSF3-8]|uniref:SusD/RagB family nutrient-binding outer membrane lipoprotein n=1 Tax=Roseivirga sp. BDSF3-8 TaxID=3241598 RepID=UPI0035320BDC
MKYYINALTLFIFIISMGCESLVGLDDNINVNPNNPTDTEYQNILVTAEVGQIILQTGESARRAGIFAGTHTGIDRQHEGYTTYTVTTTDFNDLWDDVFINAYRNAVLTQEKAEEAGVTGVTTGITQVLQALTLGTGTALYGDIPFDELADISIDNPGFEDQTAVYGKLQDLLDDAIANLATGTGRPASGADFFFDSDVQAWTQVAYTLKARYYMHTRNYAAAYEAAQNGISTFDNSLYAPHFDALEASNLNWQFFANGTRGPDLVVSDFIISILNPGSGSSPDITNYRGNAKTDETARYNYLFESNAVGFQPNQSPGAFAGQTTSAPIVTYQENLLILAEAGLRAEGFSTGLTQLNEFRSFMADGGYLENFNPANLQYDAYEAADFDTGGIENADGLSAENALLREILQERYVTLFSTIEVFNDTRRTQSETAVRVPVEPNVGDRLPQRFIYPQSEIDRNSNIPSPLPTLFDETEVNQ